jgi:hypothetical protein
VKTNDRLKLPGDLQNGLAILRIAGLRRWAKAAFPVRRRAENEKLQIDRPRAEQSICPSLDYLRNFTGSFRFFGHQSQRSAERRFDPRSMEQKSGRHSRVVRRPEVSGRKPRRGWPGSAKPPRRFFTSTFRATRAPARRRSALGIPWIDYFGPGGGLVATGAKTHGRRG